MLHSTLIIVYQRNYFATIFAVALYLFSGFVYGQDIVEFNPKRGFYNSTFQVTLSTTLPGATIRFTTDGSAPTSTMGTIYTSPVTIDKTSNIRAIAYTSSTTSNVVTHSYIFIAGVLLQPKTIAGWPNTTYNTGQVGGMQTYAVHDYEMDPSIVNSSLYSASLKTGLLSIPTMCIVMDKNQFWKSYDSPNDQDVENPASVEVLYPNEPAKNEQINCGLESHSHKRLKRSLRLKFKASYGDAKFNTRLLQTGPVNGSTASASLDNLILRAGNNRSWARTWNPDRTCYTRDEWYRQSQVEASGFGSHGTFVHLYVNGLYWGLYNPVERPDHKFSSFYFSGADSDWFAMNHDGPKDGDSTRYKYLIDVIVKKDLKDSANYEEFKKYLNVESFCDYMIVCWMTGMTDWPGNNFWGGNRNNPPSPFQYYAWDCEWSWDTTNNSNNGAWVHPAFRKLQTQGYPIASIWNSAKKNPTFLLTFADRVQKQCFGSGPLTDANSRSRWTKINNYIDNAIIAESARWGDALNDGVTRTRNDYWKPEILRVDNLMNGNVTRFINALKAEGYYPALLAAVLNSGGGDVNKGFQLTMTNPNADGIIYYTVNGEDPRNYNGAVSASSKTYSGAVAINQSSTIKVRVKSGISWSPLQQAVFTIKNSGVITGLFINEFLASNSTINVDEFGDKDDWIEVYNSTSQPIDIGGLYITDKLTNKTLWQIPANNAQATTIPAKGFKLLWADEEPVEGTLHVNLKLSNGGEQIGLFQIVGTDTFALDQYVFGAQTADISTGRFPDGTSNFITFTKPTPAASNKVQAVSTLFINEFMASNATGITDDVGDREDWIEIYNNGDVPVNIGGMYITDNLSSPGTYQIPATNATLTTIAPKGFLILWADGEPNEGVLHITPKLSNSGEQLGLYQKFGSEFLVIDTFTFKAQTADVSMGRYPDASKQQVFFTSPTPGQNNVLPVKTGLYINEFLASNGGSYPDEQGEFDDWIEIYNSNNVPVDIGGLFITDNLNNPLQYQLPATDPAKTTIPAKGFLILWADKQMQQGVLHTDLKLGAEGEQIGLVQKNGTQIIFLDSLTFRLQTPDVSSGRFPDGAASFKFFNVPTPNASNQNINRVPVAEAGENQFIVLPASSTQLRGAASDPDGDVLSYRWSKLSGPSCSIQDSTQLISQVNNLSEGTYLFRLSVKDDKGGAATDTVRVNVYTTAVVNFTLINADTDQDIRELKVSDTINLGMLPTNKLNIRATTSPARTGSVVFTLNGVVKSESTAPYSLKGDNNGDYNAWTPALGTYILKGVPYTGTGGSGVSGKALEIKFLVQNTVSNKLPIVNAGDDKTLTLPQDSVVLNGTASDPDGTVTSYVWTKVSGGALIATGENTLSLKLKGLKAGTYRYRLTVTDNSNASSSDEVNVTVLDGNISGQKVVSFMLINAANDTEIREIHNGDQINLAEMPTLKLNIKANTNPYPVGSVVFVLNGKKTVETAAPYAVKGDVNGNYNEWTPAVGSYTLSATPYTAASGGGTPGSPLSITFKVINNLAAAMRQEDSVSFAIATSEVVEMNAYPNPFVETVNIEFSTTIDQFITLEIYNEKGNVEQLLYEGPVNAHLKYIFQFDGRRSRSGVYYSRLTTRNLVRSQRLLLIK